MSSISIVSELYYLPSVEVFAHYAKAEHIILEGQEHYQKGSYRNRAHIVGANGLQRLSIPLAKGKHSQMPIQAVSLSYDEPWHKQHWASIKSAYGNAPFFLYYADELADFYEHKQQHLWAFNKDLLERIFQLLQWDKQLSITNEYQKEYESDCIDIRRKISPKQFKQQQNSDAFGAYPQVFSERHGFIANLSILDLLFCMGPQTDLYLQQISTS